MKAMMNGTVDYGIPVFFTIAAIMMREEEAEGESAMLCNFHLLATPYAVYDGGIAFHYFIIYRSYLVM